MLRKRPGVDMPEYPSDIFDEPSVEHSVEGAIQGEVSSGRASLNTCGSTEVDNGKVTQSSVACLTRILSVGEQKKAAGDDSYQRKTIGRHASRRKARCCDSV